MFGSVLQISASSFSITPRMPEVWGGDGVWLLAAAGGETTLLSPAWVVGLVVVGVATGIGLGRWWMRLRSRHRASEHFRHLELMLQHTDALLWEADVELGGDRPKWTFRMQPSRLSRRLFPDLARQQRTRITLWRDLDVPEMAEMNRRSLEALEQGRAGYQQEFRVPRPEGMLYLRETVAIQARGGQRFWLVGLVTDISELRQAEQMRQESEQSLAEILKRAECLLWRSVVSQREPGGELAWAGFQVPTSALYDRLFGDRSVERSGKLWSLLRTSDLEAMNRRSREALMQGRPGYEQEFAVTNREGQSFVLHEQVSIHALGERQWQLVGLITDITARREAERAVSHSESRYRSLFEHLPVAIVEADFSAVGAWLQELRAQGVVDLMDYLVRHPREIARGAMRVHVLAINETARTISGAKSTPELRWRRHLLDTPTSLAAVRDTFLALWEGRNQVEREMDLRRIDGQYRHVSMRWWVSQRTNGLDLSQSGMVFVDLTELKRAEADLAAQRERLAVTLRSMREGVITCDTTGAVQFINPAAVEMSGWPDRIAIGAPVERVCPFRQEDSGLLVNLNLDRARRGGQVVELPARTVLADRTGRRRLVEGQLAPVHDTESQVVGVVLVFRDITDRDRLEKELVRATRLEAVGVLAGGIAHDFNNILTAVVGNLSIAMLDTDPASSLGETVREAERATLKAKDLTQQLLTFAKGGEPVREAVDLGAVIREMAGFALHGSNVRAQFDLAEDLWLADVDKGQIGRVVQNLVLNAAQAMPEGGTLRVAAINAPAAPVSSIDLPSGQYVCITIVDTGVGIKPEHLSRIFDPYFSTKQTGSGLGLSAAYSIVRKHQGLIDVESTLGVGTTFRVWLPVAENPEPASTSTAPFVTAALRGRILFMDDESAIREMTERLLRRLGVEVVTTADGAELVDVFAAAERSGQRFDLVITDLTVPGGMGGKAALAKLKEIRPDVKVIVSSGYSSDPIMADFRAYGFCGMVAKPYQLAELRRVLQQALSATP